MDKKQIKEMGMGSGVSMAGNGFSPKKKRVKEDVKMKIANVGAVYSPKDKKKNIKNKKTNWDPAVVTGESRKEEEALREAIRELIFLNKVKYHEEQAKREIQEQKIRRAVRFLLKEENDTSQFKTTGEIFGNQFLEKITVTFKEYASLKSKKAQREEFAKMYLTGIKLHLDALDQQYYIMNPGSKPGGPQVAPIQNTTSPPVSNLQEVDNIGGGANAIGSSPVNPLTGVDTKPLVSQAIAGAVSATGIKNPTGHGIAETALNRDLPQIITVGYNSLTFDEFQVNRGGQQVSTNDRKDFRVFLIGDMEGETNEIGNIANKFRNIDKLNPSSDSSEQMSDTPATGMDTADNPSSAAVAPPEDEMLDVDLGDTEPEDLEAPEV